MIREVIIGILMPFFGTAIGSAAVFFAKNDIDYRIQRGLTGFAAGVMTAASIWSLLIPSMEGWNGPVPLSFIPAALGFWAGVFFLLLLDKIIPHLHQKSIKAEGLNASKAKRTTMLVLAVVLHNIPEGMAVGVAISGALNKEGITLASAMALSLGIAIQNFPEGAIVSLPLQAENIKKGRAFAGGVVSGVVEPAASLITIVLSAFLIPVLPYLLSFAAGAMMFVVVEELIPEMSQGEHSDIGVILFAVGFTAMMTLDVMLG